MNLPSIQLNNREKYVVSVGITAAVIIIIYQFVITPVINGRSDKRKKASGYSTQLEEMRDMKAEYESLNTGKKNSIKGRKKKDKNFNLFSFLEKLAGKTEIKASYMTPSDSKNIETGALLSLVKIKFNSIAMEQLVNFLYEVETSPEAIFVRGISITKTVKDVKLLNVVLQLETVKR